LLLSDAQAATFCHLETVKFSDGFMQQKKWLKGMAFTTACDILPHALTRRSLLSMHLAFGFIIGVITSVSVEENLESCCGGGSVFVADAFKLLL